MGKVEKVVVLSVLFLITLILVISLSGPAEDTGRLAEVPRDLAGSGTGFDPHGAEPGATMEAGERLQRPRLERVDASGAYPGPRTAPADAGGRRALDARPSDRLLNASVAAEPAGAWAGGAAGTLLRTEVGLEPSYLDEYRFYTWQSGDTWQSVADRYYADAGGLERLQRANEGRSRMAPGERILVQAVDLDAAQGTSPAAARPARAGSATTYVVEDGDSLWVIADRVYGQGIRWKEIFEANRDQLASKDDLRVGQVLRIP